MRSFIAMSLWLSLGYITAALAAAVVNHGGSTFGLSAFRHRTVSNRESVARNTSLEERGGSARFTFYQTGLGACGKYNQPSDFIVALNIGQWDGGAHCFQMITISYGGKSTQAQIVDMCPGCPPNALDLSEGLFGYFASLGAGVIYGDWSYGGGTPPPPPPSPTRHSSTLTSTANQLITSSPSSSVPTTTSTTTTGTSSAVPSSPHNLEIFQIALVELGGLITAAASLRG